MVFILQLLLEQEIRVLVFFWGGEGLGCMCLIFLVIT